MNNPQWLELPMFRTNFHGPKDVRAIEVRLYFYDFLIEILNNLIERNEESDQTPRSVAYDPDLYFLSRSFFYGLIFILFIFWFFV